MGRAKKPKKSKKSKPSDLMDARHFNSKAVQRRKEEKLVKPGFFNVYSVGNWLAGS